jgi:putative glutathione S-transferase
MPRLVAPEHDPRPDAEGRTRGMLVDGQWVERKMESDSSGAFVRPEQPFRSWLSRPGGSGDFPAESGRYHLFVAGTCPWAHRTLVMRGLLGLEDAITVDSSDGQSSGGWQFSRGVTCPYFQDKFGERCVYLHEIYSDVKPDATCIVTVPVLYDKKTHRIVSNESADIVRMIGDTMQHLASRPCALAPPQLLPKIDSVNEFVYNSFNNGVYRAGFAQSHAAHDSAVHDVFTALDALETRLGRSRYLCGDSITEADVRLLPTCVRFDQAYYTAFGCSDRKIAESYPNVLAWTQDMVQQPGVRETLDYQQYYRTQYPAWGSSPLLAPSFGRLRTASLAQRGCVCFVASVVLCVQL